MPRRISDYPDAFAGWNLISSFGSIISVVATWLFLYIVYVQLVEGKATSRYPWLTPQFYSDSLQTLLNRSYNSLEWALNSPPKPHAFVSLPLQSVISEYTQLLIDIGYDVVVDQFVYLKQDYLKLCCVVMDTFSQMGDISDAHSSSDNPEVRQELDKLWCSTQAKNSNAQSLCYRIKEHMESTGQTFEASQLPEIPNPTRLVSLRFGR
jgi:hypothetical protein